MKAFDSIAQGATDFASGAKDKALAILEEEFYKKVNAVIAEKVTPIYNTFLMIFAAIFAYFIVMEENQCYARDQSAWAVQYSNTEDVTH